LQMMVGIFRLSDSMGNDECRLFPMIELF